jgi:hypothetical protein
MPSEAAALEAWQTRAPLLVMGSHDWNVPNAWGNLSCGESRQNAILTAAKARCSRSLVAQLPHWNCRFRQGALCAFPGGWQQHGKKQRCLRGCHGKGLSAGVPGLIVRYGAGCCHPALQVATQS